MKGDKTMDITIIIEGIIAVVIGVVSLFVGYFIKSKEKREQIKEIIDIAVRAAEQLFPSTEIAKYGKEKLQYVVEQLNKKGIYFFIRR
mgnify:CR=1 FL=1